MAALNVVSSETSEVCCTDSVVVGDTGCAAGFASELADAANFGADELDFALPCVGMEGPAHVPEVSGWRVPSAFEQGCFDSVVVGIVGGEVAVCGPAN